MPAEEGLSLLLFAFAQEEDGLLFQRWVNGPQFSVSFEEFKQGLRPAPQKSEKEILEDVEHILSTFGGGGNGNI